MESGILKIQHPPPPAPGHLGKTASGKHGEGGGDQVVIGEYVSGREEEGLGDSDRQRKQQDKPQEGRVSCRERETNSVQLKLSCGWRWV